MLIVDIPSNKHNTLNNSVMPSTVISKIEYDEQNEILRIEFQSEKVYYYMNVPRGVYLTLKTARSKGGYFNKYIKGNYEFENLDPQ